MQEYHFIIFLFTNFKIFILTTLPFRYAICKLVCNTSILLISSVHWKCIYN